MGSVLPTIEDYNGRQTQHDKIAVPLAIAAFRAAGFRDFLMGTESDSPELREALRKQHDRTSIMLRYRPDQLFIKPGARTVLCEVKSEGKGYPNFAVEADAYIAALEWNAVYHHVMYAFFDLRTGHHVACWGDNIPTPREITVPNWRREYRETMQRLRERFPGVQVKAKDCKGGSGTAYFLISKRARFLQPLDVFIRRDVWRAVAAMQLELA